MPDGPRKIRFGVFEVDLAAGELRRNGSKVKLQDQPFQVLAALLEKPGEVVTKEELQARIWKDDTYVDFDRSLATAVNKIRQALGDSATRPRFIETVPKRGYRFLGLAGGGAGGEVSGRHGAKGEWASKQRLFGLPLLHIATGYDPLTGRMRIAKGIIAIGSIAVGGVAAGGISIGAIAIGGITAGIASLGGIALALWMAFGAVTIGLDPHGIVAIGPEGARVTEAVVEQPVALTAVPFTSYRGSERSPAFSPDGERIAFTWNGEDQKQFDVYTKLIGSAQPVRLTETEADEFSPVWSPDGRTLAFLRALGADRHEVITIPSSGGAERRVAEVAAAIKVRERSPRLLWSPDGRWLAALDRPSEAERFGMFAISPETGAKFRLSTHTVGYWAADNAAFSPAGGALALADLNRLSLVEWNAPLSPSTSLETRDLGAPLFPGARYMSYLPRGDEILYSATGWADVGRYRLMRQRLEPLGDPQIVAYAGEDGLEPVVSPNGDRLAYTRLPNDLDIWGFDKAGGHRKIVSSTEQDRRPEFSPDGRRIAFESGRSGELQVWASDADGSNQVQLTLDPDQPSGSPAWSPDGTRIVFDRRIGEQVDIFVMNADGGAMRPVVTHPGWDTWPYWSADGDSIFFVSRRTGRQEIWMASLKGGNAVQITREGSGLLYGADSEWVYYGKDSSSGNPEVFKIRTNGEDEQRLLGEVLREQFALTRDGAYFVRPPAPGALPQIEFLEFSTGETRAITELHEYSNAFLAASRDGRSILYTVRPAQESDIMLVEGFR